MTAPGRPSLWRRIRLVTAMALLVLAAAAGVVAVFAGRSMTPTTDVSSGAGSTSARRTETAKAVRRDLVDRTAVDGTLGYGSTRPISVPRPGMLTTLPAEGTTIERGQTLFAVDGRAVPLLYGDVPLYRTLSAASSDGPDVRQLEENLVALGFGEGVTVDDHFDVATQTAVQRWQKALGAERTGMIDPADFVFLPGPVRVQELDGVIGQSASPGGAVMNVTGTERLVQVRLDASNQQLASEGAAVQIELADGTIADGRIRKVGTVATKDDGDNGDGKGDGGDGNGSGKAKITVEVVLDDPARAGRLDEAPVKVRLTKAAAKGVLTVPITALLAVREGGYAVEVSRGSTTKLVAVEVGASADGSVEITGDVREGDDVVVAS